MPCFFPPFFNVVEKEHPTAVPRGLHRGSALRETIASQSEGYIRRIDHLVTWNIKIRRVCGFRGIFVASSKLT